MNGGQRNGTNAQIWGKQNDSNYDGNCTARHFRFGTYKISGRWILVDTSIRISSVMDGWMSTERTWPDTECAEQNCSQKSLSRSHLAHPWTDSARHHHNAATNRSLLAGRSSLSVKGCNRWCLYLPILFREVKYWVSSTRLRCLARWARLIECDRYT